MKKLLMLLASVGLTTTAAVSVVACTNNNRSEVTKTALKDLHLTTLLSGPITDQQVAFDLFIEMNSEVSDLRDNVQITDFTPPVYHKEGSLEIQAKADTKYSGTLTITIPEVVIKTGLDSLVTNATIQGTAGMTADDAFQAVLKDNSKLNGDFVEYDADSFKNSSFEHDGSLVITAKADTAYTGTTTITVKTFEKKLSNLDSTIAVDLQASQEDAFQAFLDKNQAILGNDLTLDQVDLTSFQPSQYVKNGALTITVKDDSANTWSGSVQLKIKYILKEDNIQEIFDYFASNNLFKFNVVAGEINTLTDLIYVADRKLATDMKQFYEYDDDITSIELDCFAWNVPEGRELPSIQQLNTPGTTLNLPKFACTVWFNHPDRVRTWKYFAAINITWTVVAQNS